MKGYHVTVTFRCEACNNSSTHRIRGHDIGQMSARYYAHHVKCPERYGSGYVNGFFVRGDEPKDPMAWLGLGPLFLKGIFVWGKGSRRNTVATCDDSTLFAMLEYVQDANANAPGATEHWVRVFLRMLLAECRRRGIGPAELR